MGLTCTLFRASNAEIDGVVGDPGTIDAFVESIEGPPPKMREVRPKGFLGFLLKLTPITISDPSSSMSPSATEQPLSRLLACFVEVQTFMSKAAAAGDGVIIRIA